MFVRMFIRTKKRVLRLLGRFMKMYNSVRWGVYSCENPTIFYKWMVTPNCEKKHNASTHSAEVIPPRLNESNV